MQRIHAPTSLGDLRGLGIYNGTKCPVSGLGESNSGDNRLIHGPECEPDLLNVDFDLLGMLSRSCSHGLGHACLGTALLHEPVGEELGLMRSILACPDSV